jgi:hypothetical protein
MKPIPRIVLTVAAAAVVIGGIVAISARLRDDSRLRERHALGVVDIQCEPPPGQARERFLEEVQFYGQLPEKLNTLDGDLPERLKAAFAKHPQVERVVNVILEPPNRVRVEVSYRKGE